MEEEAIFSGNGTKGVKGREDRGETYRDFEHIGRGCGLRVCRAHLLLL